MVAEFQSRVLAPLSDWLMQLEGIRFESKAEAQNGIRRVLQIVRAAGCELMFAGERVNLTVSTGTRQKAPSIRAVVNKNGRGIVLSSSVGLPKLTARPVDLPKNISE